MGDGLGGHRAASVGVQGELLGLDALDLGGGVDEVAGEAV
jgi:hypothetical protein